MIYARIHICVIKKQICLKKIIVAIILMMAYSDEFEIESYLAQIKVQGFNSRVLPWTVTKKFENKVEVETWKKFGTPYLLRGTHGGETTMSKCKLICKDDEFCEEHFSERKKIICASVKCNDPKQKIVCPVQYRLLHCKLKDLWWLQELEEWWRGPKGTDKRMAHTNIRLCR